MKIMKKLLIGAVCVLNFAVSTYAANEDENNDQNDNSLNHTVINIDNMDNDEREDLESQLYFASHTLYSFNEYENNGILNDKITTLIRRGADIANEHTKPNSRFLDKVVFNNSRYNELPDDIKNRILGESLLCYVKNRKHGVEPWDNSFDRNYKIIKKLLYKFHEPTDFPDNEGRTVFEIVENRNDLWENETYDFADTPEWSLAYRELLITEPRIASHVKAVVKKHDQKVYKLFTRYIRRNQDNNCCTIC